MTGQISFVSQLGFTIFFSFTFPTQTSQTHFSIPTLTSTPIFLWRANNRKHFVTTHLKLEQLYFQISLIIIQCFWVLHTKTIMICFGKGVGSHNKTKNKVVRTNTNAKVYLKVSVLALLQFAIFCRARGR